MLLLKYLPPPADLTKEMQVEGINAYRRGKTKTMGKDDPGMPPNQFPGTFQLQMDTLSATLTVKRSASPCWKHSTAALAPEISFQSHH